MNEFEKIERGAAAFQGNMLVNVSGGVGSCVAWQRCIEWYGADRVTAVLLAITKGKRLDSCPTK